MSIKNCSRCGKMYNYVVGPNLCEKCKKELEDKFQEVKKYITENPGSTLDQIATDNEVTTAQIKGWIREERLIFKKGSPVQLVCEKCGKPILTGRYCEACKNSMASGLNNAFQREKPQIKQPIQPEKGKGGMRFM